jgi:hypothetical protein
MNHGFLQSDSFLREANFALIIEVCPGGVNPSQPFFAQKKTELPDLSRFGHESDRRGRRPRFRFLYSGTLTKMSQGDMMKSEVSGLVPGL